MNSNSNNEADKTAHVPGEEEVKQPPENLNEPAESNNEADYWPAYVEQQKRLSCPGCGDTDLPL
jgi:hypothetical protein